MPRGRPSTPIQIPAPFQSGRRDVLSATRELEEELEEMDGMEREQQPSEIIRRRRLACRKKLEMSRTTWLTMFLVACTFFIIAFQLFYGFLLRAIDKEEAAVASFVMMRNAVSSETFEGFVKTNESNFAD